MRALSPARGGDVFSGETPARSYADIMREQQLLREKDELERRLKKQEEEKSQLQRAEAHEMGTSTSVSSADISGETGAKRSRRWDSAPAKPLNEWDATPVLSHGKIAETDQTPLISSSSRWDQTPLVSHQSAAPAALAAEPVKRSRWDETPRVQPGTAAGVQATPLISMQSMATPMLSMGGAMATPLHPAHIVQSRIEGDILSRNAPMSEEELDALLPEKGYRIVPPPPSYVPIRTPSRKLMSTPTPLLTPGFTMGERQSAESYGLPLVASEVSAAVGGDLPAIKPEEAHFFSSLLNNVKDEELSEAELNDRRIAALLLRIKNGLPPQRKSALRQITDKAREFGAGPLFNQILPLLLSPTLEDQERHLLVKVIDKLLFRLDELVRPYTSKILSAVEIMLIDEDYYARVEGRELIANLAKAVGLATMITVMRPNIDSPHEQDRNTTSRAFAVVASALGVGAVMPFLKAVCSSKRSWQARHTGAKIIQQIAILLGSGILPHLRSLVDTVGPLLNDEQQRVQIIAALAIAALAEAAAPYGIETFDSVLRPLWTGVKKMRGKALAANLKAVGMIIVLMDPEYASLYTKEIMPTIVREFHSPDVEIRKIVLHTIGQISTSDGIEADYIVANVLPEFYKAFWNPRMALDRRNAKLVVDATVLLSKKVGAEHVLQPVVSELRSSSEPSRLMAIDAVHRVISELGADSISDDLAKHLVDGCLYSFQEHGISASDIGATAATSDGKMIINGFSTLLLALGPRASPFAPQLAGAIKWRLNNKSAGVRAMAAELAAKVAPLFKIIGQDALLGHISVVLYECLGEEYPDVLGALLGGLKSIVSVVGMDEMTPPIRDLLPRLTPILKNRHEIVQANCIDLVGCIADRGASAVSAREWMRICFELLELLRAPRKAIRRAAVNTFGYIAKAVSPQDVIHTLLNNLKVQERTNRVCTTVAIAIVAETCAPFTVLPHLMAEYRTPELNVQNGVLKALSFLFEYIGEAARDYAYAVTTLLEDALMDRDPVHRQIACSAIKHLALGLQGLGCEDLLIHLLNYVWPNILETSPHVIGTVLEAIEALRVSLGPAKILSYVWQGLYHPARRVREVYWRLYNNVYVYSSHAMTPFYPRIPDFDEPHAKNVIPVSVVEKKGPKKTPAYASGRYARTYLDLFI